MRHVGRYPTYPRPHKSLVLSVNRDGWGWEKPRRLCRPGPAADWPAAPALSCSSLTGPLGGCTLGASHQGAVPLLTPSAPCPPVASHALCRRTTPPGHRLEVSMWRLMTSSEPCTTPPPCSAHRRGLVFPVAGPHSVVTLDSPFTPHPRGSPDPDRRSLSTTYHPGLGLHLPPSNTVEGVSASQECGHVGDVDRERTADATLGLHLRPRSAPKSQALAFVHPRAACFLQSRLWRFCWAGGGY